GALFRFGKVGPDALDGPGQQALEADGGGREGGGACVVVHGFLLDLDVAFSLASSARSAASSLSRRCVQAARSRCSHAAAASSGAGSSDRKWSRPSTRRR